MGRPTRARAAQIAERRRQAVQLRIKRWPWERIARELGYSSAARACEDVRRAREQAQKLTETAVAELRAQELESLDLIAQRAWEIVDRTHLVTSGTDIVRDDVTGKPLEDAGPALAALRELRQLSAERRRLLGLDAPQQVEIAGTVDYRISSCDTDQL